MFNFGRDGAALFARRHRCALQQWAVTLAPAFEIKGQDNKAQLGQLWGVSTIEMLLGATPAMDEQQAGPFLTLADSCRLKNVAM